MTSRRLAAILAADVAGYSRLMGEDEAGTARIVRERREASAPIVRGFGGRLVKTTGDGLLLEFPSVVAAVECAILIQKTMADENAALPDHRRLLYRIGVNLGDVLVEGDDILGDGVNVAARLEGVCEPGRVCVSGSAHEHVRGRIAAQFADLGELDLKNIARPVRAFALSPAAVAAASVAAPEAPAAPSPSAPGSPDHAGPPAPKKRPRFAPLAAGIATLFLVAAGGAWYFGANRPAAFSPNAATSSTPAHFSIVVLPFANLSGDSSQDYFADGITENLTTELSRTHGSFVIARNTAFTFKGKSVDAKAIGKELGVRYVLEGSVQREGGRVRVNAQFVDAETGAHLWADRFEDDVADLFKLQDEIVARLANTVGLEIVKAEAAKGKRSKNPDAIDLTMRGLALLGQGQSWKDKARNDTARDLFEQALALDPNDPDALAGAAEVYASEFFWWKRPGVDYEAKIFDLVERAIAVAPGSVAPYQAKTDYLLAVRRYEDGLSAADAGLAVNPNAAGLYFSRGWLEINLGRFERAKSDVQQAIRLSPRDPTIDDWQLALGSAELGLGQYDVAIEAFQKADAGGCCQTAPELSLAAAYALTGQMEKAQSALAKARRTEPNVSIKWMVDRHAPDLPPLFTASASLGWRRSEPSISGRSYVRSVRILRLEATTACLPTFAVRGRLLQRPVYVDSGCPLCANTGHSPTGWRTGQLDPLLPFPISPVRAENTPESGRRPYGRDTPETDARHL